MHVGFVVIFYTPNVYQFFVYFLECVLERLCGSDDTDTLV